MARRVAELPKGVWFQRKRLADGEVVRYGYLGRGPGSVSLGREGSADFHAALAEAMSKAPAEGSVAGLVHAYKASRAFTGLRPRTQADYRRHLDEIQSTFGSLSLRAMGAPRMAENIERWRDSLSASPRQADYAASVLKLLLAWGVHKGRLAFNRAAGLEKIYKANRSEKTWSAKQVAAICAVASEPLQRALFLAMETGISEGDLLRLTWAADRGTIIVGRRGKTGVAFAVPVSPALRARLDAAPRSTAVTILTRSDGQSWEPKGNGFRQAWRTVCARAGVSGVTFNDLRGTFVTSRREIWTAEEVALCSGHPIAGERGAQSFYADRQRIAIANAERLHRKHYGPDAEQNLQTGVQTAPERVELSR